MLHLFASFMWLVSDMPRGMKADKGWNNSAIITCLYLLWLNNSGFFFVSWNHFPSLDKLRCHSSKATAFLRKLAGQGYHQPFCRQEFELGDCNVHVCPCQTNFFRGWKELSDFVALGFSTIHTWLCQCTVSLIRNTKMIVLSLNDTQQERKNSEAVKQVLYTRATEWSTNNSYMYRLQSLNFFRNQIVNLWKLSKKVLHLSHLA